MQQSTAGQQQRRDIAAIVESKADDIIKRWLVQVGADAAAAGVSLTEFQDGIHDYLYRLAELLRSDRPFHGLGVSAWKDVAREHVITRVRVRRDPAISRAHGVATDHARRPGPFAINATACVTGRAARDLRTVPGASALQLAFQLAITKRSIEKRKVERSTRLPSPRPGCHGQGAVWRSGTLTNMRRFRRGSPIAAGASNAVFRHRTSIDLVIAGKVRVCRSRHSLRPHGAGVPVVEGHDTPRITRIPSASKKVSAWRAGKRRISSTAAKVRLSRCAGSAR